MSNQDEYIHLSNLSPGDASFDTHKATATEVAKLYGLESKQGFVGFLSGERLVSFNGFATKINECGNWLRFVRLTSGKIKLIDARFCKSPNCPMCQWRRSLKWRAKFLSLLPTLQEQFPSNRWLFLTLTVKNCHMQQLRQTIKHLNESFNRLRGLKDFPFDGYIKAVEVTRVWACYDSSGQFLGDHGTKWIIDWEQKNQANLKVEPTDMVHPHLHIAGMVKASYFTGRMYVTQARWTEMWKQSLRADYIPVVNVKAVKAKKLPPKPGELTEDASNDESGMVKAICEVCKYTVKESDLIGDLYSEKDAEDINSEWLKALTEQLYRMRRVEYRGILKEIGRELDAAQSDDNLIAVNEEDEQVNEDILDEVVFAWSRAISRYVTYSSKVNSEEMTALAK